MAWVWLIVAGAAAIVERSSAWRAPVVLSVAAAPETTAERLEASSVLPRLVALLMATTGRPVKRVSPRTRAMISCAIDSGTAW